MPRDPFQPMLQAGVYIVLFAAPLFFLGWFFQYIGNQLAGSVAAFLCFALFSNFVCFRIFDSVGIDRLGMPFNRPALHNGGTGLILGLIAAAFVVVVPLAFGHAREIAVPAPEVNWREQLFVPFMLLAGAAGEEILFRGFGFQVLLRAFAPASVILPVGVLFGLMHTANPSSSWFGTGNTIGFGILFGYAFFRSRDIWYPLGLHFGWNLTLLLFGATLSGLKIEITSYAIAWSGSSLWSGGAYGPEASFFTTISLVLLAVAVWKIRVVPQHLYLLTSPRLEDPAIDTLESRL